jgi:diguanylate cyclase (GGDEF)-like protein
VLLQEAPGPSAGPPGRRTAGSPRPDRARTTGRLDAVTLSTATVALVVEMCWLFATLPGAALVSDLGAVLIAGCATVGCASAAARQPTALRRFWLLLAVTMGLAAVGRSLWAVRRLAGTELPHTPLIGTVFILGIVTGTAALLYSRSAPTNALGRTRVVLDGLIVGLSLVPVGWILVFRDVAGSDLADPTRTLGLFYPMFDLVQLTVLVAVTNPARPMWRSLTLIGISLAVRSAADITYVSLVARDAYVPGHPVDVCWPLSYLLVGLAARFPPPEEPAETDETIEPPPLPWWRLALPYLPVGGTIVALLLAGAEPGQLPGLVFLTGVGLLAVLAIRQGLAANENSRLALRLRRLAYTDQLTGLPNRLLFTRRLREAIRDRHRVAVLLLDLDGFKQVNDRYGHASGDALLTQVADRMRATVGSAGTLARIGGDEFAVLIDPGRSGPPEDLAGRLLTAVRPRPDSFWPHTSASIGVAEYGPQHTGHADLLRDADIAMYAAKASGKSAYRLCTPTLREAAVTRAELIADLRRAVVDDEQLELEFQPIVDLNGGRVRGAEALVRWRHPRRGLLSPDRFLPLAEETGLVVEIDRWVIRRACRVAATLQELAAGTTVAVNVAPAHLRRPGLVATVDTAITSAGIHPSMLTLELTETALIDDTETVLDRLRQLREIGVRIAIDDFGTGYSSLSYLHRIPATDLKIDRSFVARLDGGDERAYATVEMVAGLAAAFELDVVAEGVETERQHQAVTRIGCPHGQGYRYGRPGSLTELRGALTAR